MYGVKFKKSIDSIQYSCLIVLKVNKIWSEFCNDILYCLFEVLMKISIISIQIFKYEL